jgi:hypothetical protein
LEPVRRGYDTDAREALAKPSRAPVAENSTLHL